MASDQKEMITRWFEEVWNQGRRETIDEMLGPDCVIHDGGVDIKGPDSFKVFFDQMQSTFSDFHVTTHQTISEGDHTLVRWSVSARHTGDGMGMPATGKEVHTTGMSLIRFRNGKFAEAWQNWDLAGLMQQITGASTPYSFA